MDQYGMETKGFASTIKAKDCTLCRESYGQRFWVTQGVYLQIFLQNKIPFNTVYYSKLVKDLLKPTFHSK
jgi:hypothetical protein